jgi:hypothetical protein
MTTATKVGLLLLLLSVLAFVWLGFANQDTAAAFRLGPPNWPEQRPASVVPVPGFLGGAAFIAGIFLVWLGPKFGA